MIYKDVNLSWEQPKGKKVKKGKPSEKMQIVLGRIITGTIIFGLWEALSGRVFSSFWVSKPSLIYKRILKMLSDGSLWFNFSITLQEIIYGLAIGMTIGVALGILLAYSGKFQHFVSPYIMALSSLPRAALAPLFVVWFGIGLSSKIFMVVFMVLFVSFYNAYEGIRNIDSDLINMMDSFKANKLQKLKWVVIPSISTWILNSLRIGIGTATIGAVIAEMVGSNRGLGYYISYSSALLDTTGIFTGLLIIMLVAVFLEQIIAQVEKRVLRYRKL